MLICHTRRFIFIKTVKTAGTSVEGLLEPLCVPPGHVVRHAAAEQVTAYGVVAARGKDSHGTPRKLHQHMPASAIRDQFPTEFATYTRIANVRNPYDKAISHFHMISRLDVAEAARLAKEAPEELKRRFHQHVFGGIPSDKEKLLLDDELAVNRVIRFESLLADLEQLNADLFLGLTDIPRSLPTFKQTARKQSGPPIEAYLNADSINLVNKRMDWYFNSFGYQMIDANRLKAAA